METCNSDSRTSDEAWAEYSRLKSAEDILKTTKHELAIEINRLISEAREKLDLLMKLP